jgi:ADP-heptose:LPS heptosyltransferase
MWYSKVKPVINRFVYDRVDHLIFPSRKILKKSILLVRLDAIGDFVLFRNFIEVLRKDHRYQTHYITLLGNSAWKELAEKLDSNYIDEFIWLNRYEYKSNFSYKYKKLKKITSKAYEVVLSPAYSREFTIDFDIIRKVNATEKIGSVGDLMNISEPDKLIADKFYTRLIPACKEILFEFYRNREFFEHYLEITIDCARPEIIFTEDVLNVKYSENYAVIFIGASRSYRKWNLDSFVRVITYLKFKMDLNIVLCGGEGDVSLGDSLENRLNFKCLNMVGKTTLLQLINLLANARLLLSGETSVPHLAVAIGLKNVFVIYNGIHYGRFTPYPDEITRGYFGINHPEVDRDREAYKKVSNETGWSTRLDINEISSDQVIESIKCNFT